MGDSINLESLSENELLTTLETELYRRSYYEFFKAAVQILEPATDWQFNWHFKFIADLLQNELERIIVGGEKDRDFILNLPFRAGKSLILTICFPTYVLMRDPTLSVSCVSATQDLATKFSHKSKMLIESDWYQLHFGHIFQLRTDSHAKADFMTDKGGRISAFGINTAKIVGTGSDILLLDDPQSTATVTTLGLNNTINSYRDAVHSRIRNPKTSTRFLCQQRVDLNDVSGWAMKVMPDKWFHIVIPAILTEDLKPKELAMNYTNKLFWESRFSQQVLDDFKVTMRPSMYAGQLLQRPNLIEGDLIKRDWFTFKKLSEVLPLNIQWNMVLDTAYTNNTKNDPSAILIFGKYGNVIYIRKAFRKWLQFYELLEEIKELKKNYNVNKIYVEEKASGISIVQELKRQTNYNVLSLQPNGRDKISRVISIQPILQSKRVILVQDDSWNEIFLSECANFPHGTDDIVDTLAYATQEFLQKNGVTLIR